MDPGLAMAEGGWREGSVGTSFDAAAAKWGKFRVLPSQRRREHQGRGEAPAGSARGAGRERPSP